MASTGHFRGVPHPADPQPTHQKGMWRHQLPRSCRLSPGVARPSSFPCGPLAHRVEQGTFNPKVASSRLARPTVFFKFRVTAFEANSTRHTPHSTDRRVDDTDDTPFIGGVVERVRPDIPPFRGGAHPDQSRVDEFFRRSFPPHLFGYTCRREPAGGAIPAVPRLPDLSESLRQPDMTKPKIPRKPM